MPRLQRETAGVAMNKKKICSINPIVIGINLLIAVLWAGFAYGQTEKGELKANVPALCYQCHLKMKDRLSDACVHFPFKEGKCDACHNSHAGNRKGLLKNNINNLCLSCHEKIKSSLKNRFVHYALQKGLCTDCHYAHSGEIQRLLVKQEKDLCRMCHESLQGQLKKAVIHKPFKDGECSSCHNPHASSALNQLIDSPDKICVKCHPVKCSIGGVSIKNSTEKMKCTACHSGHASDVKGLLGPYGHKVFIEEKCDQCHKPFTPGTKITAKMPVRDLCLGCHKKDNLVLKTNDKHMIREKGDCIMCHSQHASQQKTLTAKETEVCSTCHENTEKKTLLMEKALKTIRCVPLKDRKCFQCHIPPHSENRLYLKSDEIVSCARCHEGQHKVAHPLGKDTKDPRDGKQLTCITCHGMHSSKAEFMLYFDRKRQLCIQCHKK